MLEIDGELIEDTEQGIVLRAQLETADSVLPVAVDLIVFAWSWFELLT